MIIRKWKFEDNAGVSIIEKECFHDPWNVKMISDFYLSYGFVGYVAEEDGKIIGFVNLRNIIDESEISRIAVTSDYRCKGVATKLMNALIDELKNMGTKNIFLEVRRSNLNAQALYEKFGFKYIAVRENYYEGTEDALIMRKVM